MTKKFSRAAVVALVMVLAGTSVYAQTYPKRELRAVWIATVANIDWPSKKGLNVHQQQEEFVKLLDQLRHVGMNAVIVQVRPVADAFYPSSYEPWSEYLSGTQGEYSRPYYNPLAFMIEQAKQRGLEFHAWFNPYRASMREDVVHAEDHPRRKHPEWFVQYGGKWYYDPGHPEARRFVLQSIMETVKHYDLDAVHFDDYFYPYRIANADFPDSCSYQDYGMHTYPIKDDWRRHNVDLFVEELSRRIKEEKPHVKFGISPFGVWRNQDKDPEGSATQAGQTNYDDLYADVLKWLKAGWIDYVTPQLYWHIGFKAADYKVLVDWWSKHTYGKHLYIGQGIYRMGEKGWEDPDEIVNQVALNRTYSNIQGSMYFSATFFMNDTNGVNDKMRKLYAHHALVPAMDWIREEIPAAPAIDTITGNQGSGVTVKWKDVVPGNSAYYVIYRFKNDEALNIGNAVNIIAIVPRKPYAEQTWTDERTDRHTRYTYIVTAVNRLHHESEAGEPVTVKTRGKSGNVKRIP